MKLEEKPVEPERAQRTLVESEGRLRIVLENMPVMMNAFDDEGRLVMWNRECQRVTGYSADEVRGKRAVEILGAGRDELAEERYRWLSSAQDCRQREWDLTCKRGEVRTVSWSNVSRAVPIPGWAAWAIGVDVTERVRAERAMRDSEEILRALTDSSPDTLVVIDRDFRIRFVNRGQLGFSKEDVLDEPIWRFVPEGLRPEVEACFRRVVESRTTQRLDIEVPAADGSAVPFEARIGPIWREGRIVQFSASATDVSEQRRAEERYRRHFKSFPIPSYAWRRAGDDFELVDYNDAALEATGGRIPEFLGKTAREVYGRDHAVPRELECCFGERTTFRREYLHRFRTTGEQHHLDATYAFVPPDLVIVHAENIDGRKRAEEALKRSEERLAQSQRIARLGNWDWNIETNEIEWSDEVYRIFGLDPREFAPTYDAFLDTIHPEDRELVDTAVRKALQREKPYAIQHRILRKDGEVRFVHEQGEVTFDGSGRAVRMLGIVQDVTRRHWAEEQIKTSLAEKETLLREIHHRVKNNLQVVSSLLYLQSTKIEDPVVVEMFGEMERRVETMALIHENLYRSADLGRVDFQKYVKMLIDGIRNAHAGRRVSIELDIEMSLLSIDTAVPCGLIVNELVTNALQHAFPGSSPGTIRVEFRVAEGERRLSIRDDGCGLPESAFVQPSATLGLKLVQRLAEQIGARIDVRRGPGTAIDILFMGEG